MSYYTTRKHILAMEFWE